MKKILYTFLCLVFLAGCIQPHYLERIALITAFGYDKVDDGIEGTVTFFQFDPTKEDVSDTLTNKAETSKGVRSKLNLMTSHELVSGQLRVAVYGEELAKEGIFPFIDTLARDPAIGTMIYVVTSAGKAKDLFYEESATGTMNVGNYLYLMLEQNMKSETIISSTLHEFLEAYYDRGVDPILPILTPAKHTIAVTGSALFQNDRKVGELDLDETFYVKMLKETFTSGLLELTLNAKNLEPLLFRKSSGKSIHITVDNLKSDSEVKLQQMKLPHFQITINMKARLLEVSEEIKPSLKALKHLEKEVEKTMEEKIHKVIKDLQLVQSDPVGFGSIYMRKAKKSLKTEEWREIYSNATFDVHVHVNIYSTGVME